MIERILVVGQGPNDLGFLDGLRQLLGCRAELVNRLSDGSEARLRGHVTRAKQDAKYIWDHRGDVDLIVRLTDGDTDRPQDTIREELDRWPPEAHPLLVCGVCDRDVEHWMSLDPDYVARQLGFGGRQLPRRREERSGFIKNRIKERCAGQDYLAFVAGFVSNAPSETLRHWLDNAAFSRFYDQCRGAAQQHTCPVKNLRDSGGS